MALPALECNARHPSAALANGRVEVSRKILACRRGDGGIQLDGDKHLSKPKSVQPVAVIVVFGQGFRVEDASLMDFAQPFQRGARKTGSDAVGGQKPVDPLAHGDVFQLVFRKLVAVEPVGEFVRPGGQGQHGDLHHVVASREPVDQTQRFRVDQVLGIVRHHHLEMDSVAGFVVRHLLVDPIQTVALGSGAVVGAPGQMDARVAALCPGYRPRGEFVIGVDADEDVVILVTNDRQIVLEHAPDDAVFVPQRHKNSHPALRSLIQLRFRRPRKLFSSR